MKTINILLLLLCTLLCSCVSQNSESFKLDVIDRFNIGDKIKFYSDYRREEQPEDGMGYNEAEITTETYEAIRTIKAISKIGVISFEDKILKYRSSDPNSEGKIKEGDIVDYKVKDGQEIIEINGEKIEGFRICAVGLYQESLNIDRNEYFGTKKRLMKGSHWKVDKNKYSTYLKAIKSEMKPNDYDIEFLVKDYNPQEMTATIKEKQHHDNQVCKMLEPPQIIELKSRERVLSDEEEKRIKNGETIESTEVISEKEFNKLMVENEGKQINTQNVDKANSLKKGGDPLEAKLNNIKFQHISDFKSVIYNEYDLKNKYCKKSRIVADEVITIKMFNPDIKGLEKPLENCKIKIRTKVYTIKKKLNLK